MPKAKDFPSEEAKRRVMVGAIGACVHNLGVEGFADWMADQGLVFQRDFPRPGYVHLVARSDDESWEITIRPRSVLASVAVMVYEGGGAAENRCGQLQAHIHRYLYGEAPPLEMRPQWGAESVPAAVLDHFDTVVCIRARSGSAPTVVRTPTLRV